MSAESKTRMTEGSISRKIILFAIPLFFGNLFQQLYNTADSLIVGNFLGSNALAAVSSSGNLIFLMVGFINGIAMGAGVVIARYYGAKNREDLQKVIHTTVAFGLAAGLALTAIGMYLAPKILVLMGTPSDVLPQSVEYFRTYFAGSLGFVMYNIFVGILQSVGDSRHPLIYLILSSCINVVLDLFFIAGLGMGVGAAALATVISQFTSAILCLIHLMRTKEEYQLHISKIRFDGRVLGEIIRNGVPSGFQNSVISIANVFVQTNINAFGKMAMAGCGSYAKIEGFAFLPVTCFTMALTTFVSQNLGAKQYDRAKKGARFGILCSIIIAELIGAVIYTAAPTLIAAFNSDPEVVHYGVMQARTIALFYFLLAFSHCIAAVLRGSGNASIPMIVMLCVWCLFRVSYITVTVRLIPDIRVIFWAYPLTWSISSAIFLYLFLRGNGSTVLKRRKTMNAESTREALDVASLAGDILLASGAEIFRVEETIDRIARAYGVKSSDAFVLSSGIFLTAESGKNRNLPVCATSRCRRRGSIK